MSILSSLTSRLKRLFVDKPRTLTYSTSMAITFDEEFKNKMGVKITIRVSEAMRDNLIPVEELEECSNYILTSLESVTDHTGFMTFLKKLANRWNCFEPILTEETEKSDTVGQIENTFLSRSKPAN